MGQEPRAFLHDQGRRLEGDPAGVARRGAVQRIRTRDVAGGDRDALPHRDRVSGNDPNVARHGPVPVDHHRIRIDQGQGLEAAGEVVGVLSGPARKGVVPAAPPQGVVPAASVDQVVVGIAGEDVVVLGTEEILHLHEGVRVPGPVRGRARPQIRGHRTRIVPKGSGVRAGAAEQHVRACAAFQLVPPPVSGEHVPAGVPEQTVVLVVAGQVVVERGPAKVLEADQKIPPCALRVPLHPLEAEVHPDPGRGVGIGGPIQAVPAVQDIVARSPLQDIVPVVADQVVIPRRPPEVLDESQDVRAVRARALGLPLEAQIHGHPVRRRNVLVGGRIRPQAAVQEIIPAVSQKHVLPAVAEQGVGPGAAFQPIVPLPAVEPVGPVIARQHVVPGRAFQVFDAGQGVGPGTARVLGGG